MTTRRLETIRAMWDACCKGNWAAAGTYVGPNYVWIDHATGVVARTPEEHNEALADELPWSNLQFEITNAFHSDDGSVIVQAVRTGNLTGNWRSIETTGQAVSFEFIDIFKFNEDDQIVHEEAYYDMAAVMRQLGHHLASQAP
jgi:predicted ester cyclase